ncbi:MAG: alkaline phosphatase [Pseudomonadota bacterium]|nr:alkaline phosphatase [Pseudomonadota bacterium]
MHRLRSALRLILPVALLSACTTSASSDRQSAHAGDDPGAPVLIEVPRIERPGGETPQWWFRAGAAEAAERGAMAGKARNIILFVGDGMSLTTVAAARILAGQQAGGAGEETRLSWEDFPATALVRTYNTDSQTPDSAGTMTAMATGVKTRRGVINVGQQAARGDCAAARNAELLSLWQLAAATGMATGVVTTTSMSHATPSATFAHSPDRGWENDSQTPAEARATGCVDLAAQMIRAPYGQGPLVMMGGGRRDFLPKDQADPEYPDKSGSRSDGLDLTAAWRERHPTGTYVWNAAQLNSAPADAPLLGLFEHDHMQYEHERSGDPGGEPHLAQMTRAAITRLQHFGGPAAGDKGYVLLIEAGRIDHAHHAGNAFRALVDTIALDEAVRAALEMTSAEDTLILVTADHSHTLSFGGYPARGNPILGKIREAGTDKLSKDSTGLPYTTLSYSNGPGYAGASAVQSAGPKRFPHRPQQVRSSQGRPDLTSLDTTDPDYLQEALVPQNSESHGGDDVGLWASGPGSAAVRGSLEQNVVFHLMLQATPHLREALCARGACTAEGVPVELPDPADFRSR